MPNTTKKVNSRAPLLVSTACALIATFGCREPNSALALMTALDSAGNVIEATGTEEQKVLYRPDRRENFWIALIPSNSSSSSVMAAGVPESARENLQYCLESKSAHVVVGIDADVECFEYTRGRISKIFVIAKASGENVEIALKADPPGFAVASVR